MEDGTGYRVGSPFTPDTAAEPAGVGSISEPSDRRGARRRGAEPFVEGVWGQTAAAALLASVLLSLFAIAGLLIFPAGGLTVAILGVSLAIMGTSPRHRLASTTALFTHVALSIACYWQI